jgi:Spy/CpxP family protein refolding chaperone
VKRLLLSLLLLAAGSAQAKDEDPAFLKNFFTPELVMREGTAIGLDADQRSALTKDIGQVTQSTLELQWQMLDHLKVVEELSAAETLDEKKLLDEIATVMELERKVKLAHMGLLIRIRNLLTPEQRAKLRELRGT